MKTHLIQQRSPIMTCLQRINEIDDLLQQLQTECRKNFGIAPGLATEEDAALVTDIANCLGEIRDCVRKQGLFAQRQSVAKTAPPTPKRDTYQEALAIAMAPSVRRR